MVTSAPFDPEAVGAAGNMVQAWSDNIAASGIYGSPAFDDPDNIVVAVTQSGQLEGINEASGSVAWGPTSIIPGGSTAETSATGNCDDALPSGGAVSSPIISGTTGYVALGYVTAGTAHQALVTFNATNGSITRTVDVTAGTSQATNDGSSNNLFNAANEVVQAAPTILNSDVYVAYTNKCGLPGSGYVAGFPTSGANPKLWAAVTTAGDTGGGIWQGGGAITTDGTDLYVATGDGSSSTAVPANGAAYNSNPASVAQSVVRLHPDGTGALTDVGFFSPFGTSPGLSTSGVTLLPSSFSQGTGVSLAIVGSHSGKTYLLDTNNLGGRGTTSNTDIGEPGPFDGNYGAQTTFASDNGSYLYQQEPTGSSGGHLRTSVSDTTGTPTKAHITAEPNFNNGIGYGSSTPVVTSESNGGTGQSAESGLVWFVSQADSTGAGAQLEAYRAVPNNGGPLSEGWASPFFTGSLFARPLATNDGYVIVGDRNGNVRAFKQLSNTAGQSLDALPTLAFGTRAVGTSQVLSWHVRARQAFSSAAITTGSFTVPSINLAANQVADISITFAPQTTGALSSTLQIGDSTLAVTGTGTDPGTANVGFPVAPAAFPATSAGSTATETVQVVNRENVATTISAASGGPFTSSAVTVPGGTVAHPGSALITLRFAPQSAGAFANTLTLSTNVGARTLNLSGVGTASGTATIGIGLGSGTSANGTKGNGAIDLGGVKLKGTAKGTLTLTNVTATSLTLFSVSHPKAPFSDASIKPNWVLTPGASLKVPLAFHPTKRGNYKSSVVINASDGKHTVNLTGSGLVQQPGLSSKLWVLSNGATKVKTAVVEKATKSSKHGTVTLANGVDLSRLKFQLAISPGSAGVALNLTSPKKGSLATVSVVLDAKNHRIAIGQATKTGYKILTPWVTYKKGSKTVSFSVSVDNGVVTLQVGKVQVKLVKALKGIVKVSLAGISGKGSAAVVRTATVLST
jgi:hypothetical protein